MAARAYSPKKALLDADLEYADGRPTRGCDLWEELLPYRRSTDQRAKRAAMTTLPYLASNFGNLRVGWNHKDAPSLRAPYAGENGDVIETLAGELGLALWPPSAQSLFLGIDPITRLETEGGEEVELSSEQKTELRREGMAATTVVLSRLQALEIFPTTVELEKTGMVAGGFLLSFKKRFRNHRLDTYVLDRDPWGVLLDIVTREIVPRRALPKKYRDLADRKRLFGPGSSPTRRQEYNVYTWVRRTKPTSEPGEFDGEYREVLEIEGERAVDENGEDQIGIYPAGQPMPWLYVPWIQAYDEVYGRSKVELLYGMHTAFEAVTRMLLEKGAAVSRHLTFISKDAGIDLDEFLAMPNLGANYGDFTKVGSPAASVNSDTNFLLMLWQRLQERLSAAYGQTQFKPVERRTAAEATIQLQETQKKTGGAWAMQVPRFQIPVVRMIVKDLLSEGVNLFPSLKKEGLANAIVPKVHGGLEAYMRTDEGMRRDLFYASASAYLASAFAAYSDRYAELVSLAQLKGVDVSESLKDSQAMAEADRGAALAEATKGIPLELVKQAMTMLREQMSQPQTSAPGAAPAAAVPSA